MKIFANILCILCFGCGTAGKVASRPDVVDFVGYDFSACVADDDGFDVCAAWVDDNELIEHVFLPPEDVFKLNFDACFDDLFTSLGVCWEFFIDNDEQIWGWILDEKYTESEFIALIKENFPKEG